MKRVELCPSSCRSNVSRTFKYHWFTRESWDGSVGNLFNDTTTCSSFDFNAVNREQKSVSVGLLSATLTQKSSRFEWAIIRTQFDDSLLVKMKDKGMSSPGARWLFLSGHQIVRMHSGEADKRRLRFSLLRLETPVGEPVPCTALFLGGTSLSEVCQFSSQKCHSKKEPDFTRVWIQLIISTRISSFLYTISALNNWVWISKSQRQSGKPAIWMSLDM